MSVNQGKLSSLGLLHKAVVCRRSADPPKEQNVEVDLVVQRPRVEFREFARAVISLGADIYYGHSAHVFQGVEIFNGKPILYDTGDFIDDYAVDPFMRNDWSFLFQVVMDGQQLKRIDMFPVKLDVAKVKLAHGEQWESIMRRMELLCDEMGTSLTRRDRHLVYEPD